MSVEPPGPKDQDHFRDDRAPDESRNSGWRAAETVADIRHQQKTYIRDESVAADAIARTGGPDVEPYSHCEHCKLHGQSSSNRVPQSKSKARSAGIERHVWAMRNPVENPMAHHAHPDREGARPIARDGVVDERKRSRPHAVHQQTVRPGIVIEIQWSELRIAGIDAHMLPTHQQEKGPQQVGK